MHLTAWQRLATILCLALLVETVIVTVLILRQSNIQMLRKSANRKLAGKTLTEEAEWEKDVFENEVIDAFDEAGPIWAEFVKEELLKYREDEESFRAWLRKSKEYSQNDQSITKKTTKFQDPGQFNVVGQGRFNGQAGWELDEGKGEGAQIRKPMLAEEKPMRDINAQNDHLSKLRSNWRSSVVRGTGVESNEPELGFSGKEDTNGETLVKGANGSNFADLILGSYKYMRGKLSAKADDNPKSLRDVNTRRNNSNNEYLVRGVLGNSNSYRNSLGNAKRWMALYPKEDQKPLERLDDFYSVISRYPNRRKQIVNGPAITSHDFRYLINPGTSFCGDDNVTIIAFVPTALDHYQYRATVRKTWGVTSNYATSVRRVFVVGVSDRSYSKRLQTLLENESQLFGDIVQLDFIDSYQNLPYKTIAGLRWVSNFCNRTKYVLKIDDDTFVNMFGLIQLLERLELGNHIQPMTILGRVVFQDTVHRTGKWAVKFSDFPYPYYPTYCSGPAYVVTIKLAVAMYQNAVYVPFFYLEDLYVTGFVPLLIGNVYYHQLEPSYAYETRFPYAFLGSVPSRYLFGTQVESHHIFESTWFRLKNQYLNPNYHHSSNLSDAMVEPRRLPPRPMFVRRPDQVVHHRELPVFARRSVTAIPQQRLLAPRRIGFH